MFAWGAWGAWGVKFVNLFAWSCDEGVSPVGERKTVSYDLWLIGQSNFSIVFGLREKFDESLLSIGY